MNTESVPSAEHLTGFDCGRCGHTGAAHFRNPSCRNCRCSADPVCWCGLLASKHGDHDCETCQDCIHDGNKCCGCYDGACCHANRWPPYGGAA